ncbi:MULTISPECIES: hypothetical protein [unclassified Sporosarcina]|uniref:hypothetical protein n=1 Tax=unclassified Sporosarcina TaxID=2647733 RepID=UPI001A91DD72|nr:MULTISPECIES: hypothetical protein [unclassified Sporosarcina]MBO0587607.1 hypothetical protein [Sporosarcina sp. E16_8]MBO0602404.1 hypothetical protein [Sporosarcina sp. E16_3]
MRKMAEQKVVKESAELKALVAARTTTNIQLDGIRIDPKEIEEILKSAPAVNVKDAVPESVKLYSVSKEFDSDEV